MKPRYIFGLIILVSAYFIAGKLGLSLAYIHTSASAVWPPTGIALAALLIFGYRYWPGIFIGAFLVNITTAGTIFTSLGIATGNTLEAIVGAYLINKYAGGRYFTNQPYDFLKFVLLAGFLATTISATLGVASLVIGGFGSFSNFIPVWFTWWFGDAVGALTFTPFLVLLALKHANRWNWLTIFRFTLVFSLFVAASAAIFSGIFPIMALKTFPFFILPFLIWIALQFGQLEVSLAILTLSVIAVHGNVNGFGPFVFQESANRSLLMLQAFVGIVAVTFQVLSSAVFKYKIAKQFLQQSENRFRSLIENSSDVITVSDSNGQNIYTSPTVEKILGYKPKELIGVAGLAYVHPDDVERVTTTSKKIFKNPKEIAKYELRVRHKNGSWIWVEASSQNLLHDPAIAGIVSNFRDITDRKNAEERLLHQSLHDPLTNLPNRKAAEERLKMVIDIAKRNNSKLAVLFLDLDRFKNVNDSLGHDIGDLLLQEVAYRLKKSVREEDTVARLGGDEFLIILREVSSPRDAIKIAQKILLAIEPNIPIGSNGLTNNLSISGSIGITIYPDNGINFQALFKNSDTAMYRAKEAGRRCCQLYSPKMNRGLAKKMRLEENMREAFEKGQFTLCFQPYVDLNTNQLQGVEALIRWNHPKLGLLHPDDFISIAEETGMIVPLGEWVMERTCREVKKLADKGILIHASVNLSARQFSDPTLVKNVARILKDTGLDPKYLELEITESIAMQSVEETHKKLVELRKMGLSIAIDDFGMGYSSLGYLKLFPVQKLKIDSSFVQNMSEDKRDSALIHAIISLGHDLGLHVCAEGIEKELHKTLLDAMGCDLGQGFLISGPLTSRELAIWIENSNTNHTFSDFAV